MNKSTLKQYGSNILAALALAVLPANLAHAEGSAGEGFASLVPLVLIMVIFWVLLIRPQQKRMKEHAEVIKNLKKGDKVTLVGFGTFSVSKRDARQGRNPQTGNTIEIPEKKVVKFKAGSKLSETVN